MLSEESIRLQVGSAIRKVRHDVGLSQEKVAELAGLHRTFYGDLERGKNNPSIITLVKIARVFNVAVDEIIKQASLDTDN